MLERIVEFLPAWDKRDSDPSKNFGIHGVTIRFLVKGDKGVAQFVLYTNWMLPHLRKKWDDYVQALILLPMPSDLGYHSKTPIHSDQTPLDCDLLDTKKCYYDGSTLAAEKFFDILVEKGHEALWLELEAYYKEIFD